MAHQRPNPTVAWNVLALASLLALAPDAVDDYGPPIRWLEDRLRATPAPPPLYQRLFSNALGGILLRAERFDEAVSRVEGGIAAFKDLQIPSDLAYLALAHARAGRPDAAREWLDQLRAVQLDPNESFWDVRALAILRGEAESLLFGADIPSDPFQPADRERPRGRITPKASSGRASPRIASARREGPLRG